MAFSGTRMRRCSRCPSGLTNAFAVTSFGMSWADVRDGSTRISAATHKTIVWVLTKVFRASSIAAARAYNGKGGVNEKRGAEAQLLCRRGIRFGNCRARSLSGFARKQGRHVGTHRPGADFRSRSAVAEASAESLAPRLDHRSVGRRAGPRSEEHTSEL